MNVLKNILISGAALLTAFACDDGRDINNNEDADAVADADVDSYEGPTDNDYIVLSHTSRQVGSYGEDWCNAMIIDEKGNIYVAGHTDGQFSGSKHAGGMDALLIKWDANGTVAWIRQWGSEFDDRANDVVIDANGDIIVAGKTSGKLDGQKNYGHSDVFITRWTAAGDKIATVEWGTAEDDVGSALAVDKEGNIYVFGLTLGDFVGYTPETELGLYAFLYKLNADGTTGWVRQWGETGLYNNDIALDSNGYIVVSYGGGDIAKWTPEGNLIFMREPDIEMLPGGLAVNDAGEIFVTGSVRAAEGEVPDDSMLWLKRDAGGLLQWREHKEKYFRYEDGHGIALDETGNLYVGGHGGFYSDYKALLVKADRNGEIEWVQNWGTEDYSSTYVTEVAIDRDKSIVVAGTTGGDMDGNVNAGIYDIFLTFFPLN
ncbi:MAG TPA: SBBP repeat-containing protein [bacterium]|nr:SBBP repeat-containing protein [bacterium]